MNILVTGSKGQLGSEIRFLSRQFKDFNFYFFDIEELDITSEEGVNKVFDKYKFNYCINTAAYTAVDKAEVEKDLAFRVNTIGADNLAKASNKTGTVLIHISTDFVFDGTNNRPLDEEEVTIPINLYGKSKLEGEERIKRELNDFYILRTSWLYSSFGNNFVKTMQRLGREKNRLGVIIDQIGTPTYARDLAQVIMDIIKNNKKEYGLYHYSNEGVASWYDFACLIFKLTEIDINVEPIPTTSYPTRAKRPVFSLMDKTKIKNKLNIVIPHWTDSLSKCLEEIDENNQKFK